MLDVTHYVKKKTQPFYPKTVRQDRIIKIISFR